MRKLISDNTMYLSSPIQDIVVRICFTLGNMTAKNDNARLLLHQEKKSLEIILTVLKSYLEQDIKVQYYNIPIKREASLA